MYENHWPEEEGGKKYDKEEAEREEKRKFVKSVYFWFFAALAVVSAVVWILILKEDPENAGEVNARSMLLWVLIALLILNFRGKEVEVKRPEITIYLRVWIAIAFTGFFYTVFLKSFALYIFSVLFLAYNVYGITKEREANRRLLWIVYGCLVVPFVINFLVKGI